MGSLTGGLPRIVIHEDAAGVARAAAEEFAAAARGAVAARGRFAVALAGGSTPKALYRLLRDGARDLPWPATHVFFGDERSVGPDHPDSNYRMAAEALLDSVPVARENVHRMRGEAQDLDLAAADYAADLEKTLGPAPRLDLALLGMGSDGHTASLFPGTSALAERARTCCAVRVPQLATSRITLTYPVFEAARAVMFLIAGPDKADTLKLVLEGSEDPVRFPSQVLMRCGGPVTAHCDRASASALSAASAG